MNNFLYTFVSWRYLWRVKVGISARPWGRRKEVARALGYTVGPYLPMVWAKPVEKAIHTVFAKLNTQTGVVPFGRIPDYSGSTEHFWTINIFSFLLASVWAYGTDAANGWEYLPIALLFAPLPLDIVICVVIYWLAQLFVLHLFLPYLSGFTSLAWLWVKYQFINFWNL